MPQSNSLFKVKPSHSLWWLFHVFFCEALSFEYVLTSRPFTSGEISWPVHLSMAWHVSVTHSKGVVSRPINIWRMEMGQKTDVVCCFQVDIFWDGVSDPIWYIWYCFWHVWIKLFSLCFLSNTHGMEYIKQADCEIYFVHIPAKRCHAFVRHVLWVELCALVTKFPFSTQPPTGVLEDRAAIREIVLQSVEKEKAVGKKIMAVQGACVEVKRRIGKSLLKPFGWSKNHGFFDIPGFEKTHSDILTSFWQGEEERITLGLAVLIDIAPDVFHIFLALWHSFWHPFWKYTIYSDNLWITYSDILSGIHCVILYHHYILSGIRCISSDISKCAYVTGNTFKGFIMFHFNHVVVMATSFRFMCMPLLWFPGKSGSLMQQRGNARAVHEHFQIYYKYWI